MQADTTLAAGRKRGTVNVQLLLLLGILVLVMAVSTILTPKFLTYVNMVNVLMQVAMIMLTGSAAVLLMIAGQFRPVGGHGARPHRGHARLHEQERHPRPPVSMVLAILIGSVFGLLNGAMVAGLKITPVIATLGTMYVAQGLAFIVAWIDGGANVTTGLPRDFQVFGRTMVGPIPLFLLHRLRPDPDRSYFLFAKTNLRKYAFAIGGNPVAARLSGIKVGGVVLAAVRPGGHPHRFRRRHPGLPHGLGLARRSARDSSST